MLNQYPEFAYILSAGISMCNKCHLRVTHSDEINVRRFRFLFYAYLNREYIKEYNMRYQHKVGDVYLPTEEDMEKYGISKGWTKKILDPVRGYEF